MKIIVFVKQVPDTWQDRVLDPSTGWLDRGASERVIDEICERALEVALAYKDGDKATEIVALSMGPTEATAALRKALSMGADAAVHVVDDALVGADATRTAAVLAAAATATGYDLIIAGNESTDGRGGVVPAMVAEHLGLPSLTFLTSVELNPTGVTAERGSETAATAISASLPAVISITERMPEARFPSFKGIMTAKKKPVTTYSLADLGIDGPGARSTVRSTEKRPARSGATPIVDEGNAGVELADYLAQARLI